MSDIFKKFGPTGKFPRGKLNTDDEGELQFGIATDYISQTIKIHFGKPVAWFGISSTDAREIAKVLIEKADELEKRLT